MKKILYISPFNIYPPTTGGSRYIYNYVKELSKVAKLYYFGLKDQEKIPSTTITQHNIFASGLKKYSNPLSYYNAFTLARKIKPDEIIVAMPYQLFFAIFVSKILKSKSIHHEQNIEFLRFKRIGRWWWPLMYLFEKAAYRLVDETLYISETDKTQLINYFNIPKHKLTYSPYLVDTDNFKPNNVTRLSVRKQLKITTEQVILFFGPLNYPPNKEAVGIILNKIFPYIHGKKKRVKFLIAGKHPPKIKKLSPDIIFTGFVDKIEDYINASDIVIVPLLSGGGIRTKILESLACDKIVIATTMGAEGINPKDFPNKLFIYKDLNKFNEKLLKI